MTSPPRIYSYDERRTLIIPGPLDATLTFCLHHFADLAKAAVKQYGRFCIALSGGSTPKTLFHKLLEEPYRSSIPWQHCWLFWSDERCVPLDHSDSNYRMAMDAAFSQLPVPNAQIFPMYTNPDLKMSALHYESVIQSHVPMAAFDLVMLGMGNDGHTASLFPHTHGLHPNPGQLVISNFLPDKNVWRLSFTMECINTAKQSVVYVLGKEKAETVKRVFTEAYHPDDLPIQSVGTKEHPALWILDEASASAL